MTLTDIERTEREFLIPSDIAPLIGCDPQDIRAAAREHPELLGFHVCVIGTRVKIPRRAFLRWIYGGEMENVGVDDC